MQMLSHFQSRLERAEAAAIDGDITGCLRHLRALPLSDFGLMLFNLDEGSYPAITSVLPKMADVKVQRDWTGTSGLENLKATINFIQTVSYGYQLIKGESLRNKKILDYGCGYGRMIRLMYYFSDPASIYGCDPWTRSIDICKEDRLLGNLYVSDYLPTDLPFIDQKFDFVYSNSVFTHTSERATMAALSAIRKSIKEDGLLVITIRPLEFWQHYSVNRPPPPLEVSKYIASHVANDYAFRPHNRAPIDGDITYGDSSFSYKYFDTHFPDWQVLRIDRTLDSPFQLITFLRPR